MAALKQTSGQAAQSVGKDGAKLAISQQPTTEPECSFCHRTAKQVQKLIVSDGHNGKAYICNYCIVVCYKF